MAESRLSFCWFSDDLNVRFREKQTFDISTINRYSRAALFQYSGHPPAMLTEIYIEALLVDEDLAEKVWKLWDVGIISDDLAAIAWCILADALQRKQVKANPIS